MLHKGLFVWQLVYIVFQSINLYGIDKDMPQKESKILFADKLDGNTHKGWIVPPADYVKHPEFGMVYYIKPQIPPLKSMPHVGNGSWRCYRVELEALPAGLGMGFFGLDFHVQDNGACSNMHFSDAAADHQEILQSAVRWNTANTAWKLMPLSQRRPVFKKNKWISLRVDVGEGLANVYVDSDTLPVYTIYDLPFTGGGIRFFSYGGSAYIRNLVVTELDNMEVTPLLADDWQPYRDVGVLRNWYVSSLLPIDFGSQSQIPQLAEAEIGWCEVSADDRGIVNISALFPDNNDKAVVYARTTIHSADNVTRRCKYSYTDQMSIWCNGQLVVTAKPRGWADPGRGEADGWGRIIPDQFETSIELLPGDNVLLLRLQVNEPQFGSGFWFRLQ
ncbi:MAG TPA: hypothetical protein PLP19_19425 [bacterium]|nr:hypothetical protein [bacterium]HPN45668.1 hypothetical protein [bacterium]